MAITDLQISDTLETGAPSIKYTGNEGPQAPMQMAEADPILVEQYQQYVFEMEEQGLQPMSFEEFKAQAMSGMAEGGRPGYGLGSLVRKLIPNEIAKVAEVAAPFVAPFNPVIGGALAGVGGYDRTGNLMGSALRGLGTYGLGQVARYAGGAGPQWGLKSPTGNMGTGLGSYFTSPMSGNQLFGATPEITGASGADKRAFTDMPKYLDNFPGPAAGRDAKGSFIEETIKKIIPASKEVIKKSDTGEKLSFIKKLTDSTAKRIILGAMAGTGLYTALSEKGDMPLENLEEIARGEGMDIEGIRAEVQEALAGGEAAWNELKKKYPYIGEYGTKVGAAEGGRIGFYAGGGAGYPPVTLGQADNPPPMPGQQPRPNPMPAPQPMAQPNPMAPRPNQNPMGGRMNPMAGGIMGGGMNPMMGGRRMAQEGGLMDLGGMEKDYRNDGGFVPIGGQEKADDVPARLSKNEFVFTADAVRNAGGGDIDKGAEIMERMMENLEQGGQVSEESQGMGGAQEMFDISERLSEVV